MLNHHEATAHIEAIAASGEEWALDALRSLRIAVPEPAIDILEDRAVEAAQAGDARRATYYADIMAGLIVGMDQRRSEDQLRTVWEQLSAVAAELYACGHETAAAHVDALCDRIDIRKMAFRPAWSFEQN